MEKLLRKINPYIFTLTQHRISWLIARRNHKPTTSSHLLHTFSLANFSTLGCDSRSSYTGLVSLSSLLNQLTGSQLRADSNRKICDYMLNKCSTVRMYLNTRVALVGYDTKNPEAKNRLVCTRYGSNASDKANIGRRESFQKSYDYVVITFPLIKNIEKQQNFTLDILYRDFLDCELNTTCAYIIDGQLKDMFVSNVNHEQTDLYTTDPSIKFQSIRALREIDATKSEMKINESLILSKKLYVVNSIQSDLSIIAFEAYFKPGYKQVEKKMLSLGPMIKNVRYYHTAFPQIILDSHRRSRVFYLNSLEWLESSREMSIVSARNIALLLWSKEVNINEKTGKHRIEKANIIKQSLNEIGFSFGNYINMERILTLSMLSLFLVLKRDNLFSLFKGFGNFLFKHDSN